MANRQKLQIKSPVHFLIVAKLIISLKINWNEIVLNWPPKTRKLGWPIKITRNEKYFCLTQAEIIELEKNINYYEGRLTIMENQLKKYEDSFM